LLERTLHRFFRRFESGQTIWANDVDICAALQQHLENIYPRVCDGNPENRSRRVFPTGRRLVRVGSSLQQRFDQFGQLKNRCSHQGRPPIERSRIDVCPALDQG